ncbi:hypothetical protein [Oceanobacillus chungangensis]|uniref:hypothetical protein n=1 Tax=Oceanobacillus chungangensis TaxID=1229152 RepID=UPI001FEAE153|nr:hypothetical protein [Oceanobacillus chungangensis]
MYKKISNIDFTYFIGQKVTEVNTEKNLPLGVAFETAGLIIECPWRLQASNEVLIGYSDCIQKPDGYSHKNVEKILLGRRIINIIHFEGISDLVVEFEGSIYLELFHDSNYFEGWQLRGDNGFYLFTLPGGTYSD